MPTGAAEALLGAAAGRGACSASGVFHFLEPSSKLLAGILKLISQFVSQRGARRRWCDSLVEPHPPLEVRARDVEEYVQDAFSDLRLADGFVARVVTRSLELQLRQYIMVFGHQGVGKSSLCNLLRGAEASGLPVAAVGPTDATTLGATAYKLDIRNLRTDISPEDEALVANIVDTKGWSPSEPGSLTQDYIDVLTVDGVKDKRLRPCVVLFVMSASSLKDVNEDVEQLRKSFRFDKFCISDFPPLVIPVVTHDDAVIDADRAAICRKAREMTQKAFDGKAKSLNDWAPRLLVADARRRRRRRDDLDLLKQDLLSAVFNHTNDKNFRLHLMKVLAEDLKVECKHQNNRYPFLASEWGLFKSSVRALARGTGRTLGEVGPVCGKSRPPWDLLHDIASDPGMRTPTLWLSCVWVKRDVVAQLWSTAVLIIATVLFSVVASAIWWNLAMETKLTEARTNSTSVGNENVQLRQSLRGAFAKVNETKWQLSQSATEFKVLSDTVAAACADYMIDTGCAWTQDWNCPGQESGWQGPASSTEGIGYACCCSFERWRDTA